MVPEVTERAIRVVKKIGGSLSESFANAKQQWAENIHLDYQGAKDSRFRRRRNNLGGSADAHYGIEHQFWELREYARDMDRNDPLVGQMVDRVLDNVVGCGFKLNPQTGDPARDREIVRRWNAWAADKFSCDVARRHTIHRLARLALRHQIVDGDVCALLNVGDRGAIQLVEGDLLWSTPNMADNIIHGVELDNATNAPLRYHFTRRRPEERERTGKRYHYDTTTIDAVDGDGLPLVLHMYQAQRVSQSRGVTAFRAVFEQLGMYEDVQFSKLVQQQMVSCLAAVVVQDVDSRFGARTTQTGTDGEDEVLEELSPGIVARLRPGEDIRTVSPSFSTAEWKEQATMILRAIFAQLGLPLCVGMLDTSNTTFHGYRGELQQARMTWGRMQQDIAADFYTPVFNSWSLQPEQADLTGGALLPHSWQAPGWPYVDPKTDAEAERVRLRSGLDSLRRIHADHGREWEDVAREIVEDNASLIRSAQEAASQLGDGVTWRDVAGLDAPAGVQVMTQAPGASEPEPE